MRGTRLVVEFVIDLLGPTKPPLFWNPEKSDGSILARWPAGIHHLFMR